MNLPGLVNEARGSEPAVAQVDFATGKGELVRLDLATGAIDWRVELDTMPFGAVTISNDLLFTTLFDGRLVAHSLGDGSEVWSSRLPAGTNSPLAIAGDRLVTAAGFPQGSGQSRRSSPSSSTASESRLPQATGTTQTQATAPLREVAPVAT